jgi:hypothetical protein
MCLITIPVFRTSLIKQLARDGFSTTARERKEQAPALAEAGYCTLIS